MANKLSKNLEKGGAGVLIVAAAEVITSYGISKGVIPADSKLYVTAAIGGFLSGAINFVKHAVSEIKAKRKARGR